MGAARAKIRMLPLSRTVIHVPGDNCPACGNCIFEKGVKLITFGNLHNGSWSVYECACGHVWRQYWPGVGKMIRKAMAVYRRGGPER